MTVLLQYTDCLLQFSIIMLNIAINICFALPYCVGIMLNAFNHPLCSKVRWHKGGFLLAIAIFCLNYPVILFIIGIGSYNYS